MIEGFPHAEYPIGWFQVAWSPQIEPGQVIPLEFFGMKLIAYRGAGGSVYVMDAYCRHLGAHLFYGGIVEGEAIRCGFHGWCWGPDGRNTEVPYSELKQVRLSMRTYPTREVDGLILMWFDPSGAEPTWEPPRFLSWYPETTFFDLFPSCVNGDRVRMQPQMMVENSVDFAHLVWTHRWTGKSSLESFEADGHRFVAEMRGFLPTKQGVVPMTVVEHIYGVGMIVGPMSGVRDVLNVVCTTPIDHDYSYVFMSTFVSCPEGGDPAVLDKAATAIVKAQRQEVIGTDDLGDRKIWENQRYVARPPLMPEEVRGVRAVRAWAAQFYPKPAAVAEAARQ